MSHRHPIVTVVPTCISYSDFVDAHESNLGFCTDCREFTTSCVEPDAEHYECDLCDGNTVMGAEQALLVGEITIGGGDTDDVKKT